MSFIERSTRALLLSELASGLWLTLRYGLRQNAY